MCVHENLNGLVVYCDGFAVHIHRRDPKFDTYVKTYIYKPKNYDYEFK